MTSSDHLSQRRPSHALPSQALKTPASVSPISSKTSKRFQTARQIYGRNIKNLAERARQRHEQRKDDSSEPQVSPEPALISPTNSPSHLPDVEDNQAPRNSALYRRYTAGLSPFPHSATPRSAELSFHGHRDQFSHRSKATDREEDIDEAKLPTANVTGQTHDRLNDRRTPSIRQNLWQTISALSLNQKRLTITSGMQDILCHAVSMYYCGMGDKVLADLNEVQEKARRMDLRVINGQAQLWRAIILDEIGQTESIAELLADALFLLAAVSGDALLFAEVPPEDADFYQLWRMVWVRKYWYSLWKYLKMEDAKENPDIPKQDLGSEQSKDEAQEWTFRFLDRLKNCFDHSKWPGFDRGRISVRFSRVNDASLDNLRGGPLVQRIQVMAERLHELEVKDRENTSEIEKLTMNNIRYKAEREVFDTNLSTGHTHDSIYPHDAVDESVKDRGRPVSAAPSAIDRDPGLRHDSVGENVFAEPRLSAALGPDQVELLYQNLRNGNIHRTEPGPHSRLVTHKSPPAIVDSQRQSAPTQRPLRDKFYDNMQGIHLSGPHKRVSLWAQQAHGGQVKSVSSSQSKSPLSPNNITPSSPSSGRSWRHAVSLYNLSPKSSGQSERGRLQVRNPDEPLSQTGITPSTAWKTNVLPLLATKSTDNVEIPVPQLDSKNTSPVQVEASFKTLYDELAEVLLLKSERWSYGLNSTTSSEHPSAVEDPLLLRNHQHGQASTKPVYDELSYNAAKSTSISSGFRTAARSPKSISPLANPEDLPLTDTLGGHQLQETLSNIRAHQEQRQKSILDTSPISEGLNKLMLTQGNGTDTHPLAQQDGQTLRKRRNRAAGGSASLSPYEDQSQMLSLGGSPNEGDRSSTAASDISQKDRNIESTDPVLDRTRHAGSSNVQQSRSTEDKDQQIQPPREANVGGAKLLKLQMPQIASSSEYRRRASVAPASPSPLRTSFSQAAFNKDPEFVDAAEGSA